MNDVKVPLTIDSAYLAGPMRGIPNYNFPAFRKATAQLRAEGWTIFSPAERDEQDPEIDHTENVAGWSGSRGLDYFMAHDLKAVCEHDAVIVLPGWERSQGARLETITAVEIGHPVFAYTEKRSRPGGLWFLGTNLEYVEPEYIRAVFSSQGLPAVAPSPEHELSENCWCGPDLVDRGETTVIVHRDVSANEGPLPKDGPFKVVGRVLDELHAERVAEDQAAMGIGPEPVWKSGCSFGGGCGCKVDAADEEPDNHEEAVAEILQPASEEPKAPTSALPTGSQERKDVPLAQGVLDYFPAALAEVARVSKAGNDKHNPGQPMHHARGKSTDHADCIVRHLVDRGAIDPETGMRHSAAVAWRALALLQQELEDDGVAPMPRGAKA